VFSVKEKIRRIYKETKIVSSWQTGNKEASKKMRRDSRSASVQADAIEENGNQTEDVICTYCEGRFYDVQGEIRVQYVMCEDWCHEECAGVDKD
jgi:hypothetical protein